MDGLELLQLIRRDYPLQTVVMMTAYGHIDLAVEAMRGGPTTLSPNHSNWTPWCCGWKKPWNAAG
jgi:DNA-binding NarL/FixJ family response regulator